VKSVTIPPQIVVKLTACVMALAVFVLLGILPQQRGIENVRRQIGAADLAMQRHNALAPTYAKLKATLAKGLPQVIPPVNELHLTQDRITEIPAILSGMAADKGVRAESVVPDPASIAKGGHNVSVDCSFRGPLKDLEALLLELGALSCLTHVEHITVREDHAEANLQLKAWMALE